MKSKHKSCQIIFSSVPIERGIIRKEVSKRVLRSKSKLKVRLEGLLNKSWLMSILDYLLYFNTNGLLPLNWRLSSNRLLFQNCLLFVVSFLLLQEKLSRFFVFLENKLGCWVFNNQSLKFLLIGPIFIFSK